jgi:hypothetical protein
MAGTNADIATLTNDNAFIASVRAEMIKKAAYVLASSYPATPGQLTVAQIEAVMVDVARARRILASGAADATRVAANIAAGNGTTAAAAPAVPNDGAIAWCINDMWSTI